MEHMDPHTKKTILWVGVAAAATGVAIALWPKAAAATPSSSSSWKPATVLTPGMSYMVAVPVSAAAPDRLSVASLLQTAGWSNGAIAFFPNDPSAATWPAEMPAGLNNGNTYIFMGTWSGPPSSVDPQQMTVLQFTG